MFNISNPLESADSQRPTVGVGRRQIGLVGKGLKSRYRPTRPAVCHSVGFSSVVTQFSPILYPQPKHNIPAVSPIWTQTRIKASRTHRQGDTPPSGRRRKQDDDPSGRRRSGAAQGNNNKRRGSAGRFILAVGGPRGLGGSKGLGAGGHIIGGTTSMVYPILDRLRDNAGTGQVQKGYFQVL